jgi:hypothetical protein
MSRRDKVTSRLHREQQARSYLLEQAEEYFERAKAATQALAGDEQMLRRVESSALASRLTELTLDLMQSA